VCRLPGWIYPPFSSPGLFAVARSVLSSLSVTHTGIDVGLPLR